MNKAELQERARSLLNPIVSLLEERGVTPTQVTLFGLGAHVLAAVIIGLGQPLTGGIVLALAAASDGLDGMLARRTGRVTRFGAFLDSSVDRIDETVIMAGIAAYFVVLGGAANMVWSVLVLIALGGSLITSYTRARAEGLGLECKVGAFERPERVLVTVVGLLFGHTMLVLSVVVLTLLSWFTVYQRIQHVQSLVGDQPLDATVSSPGGLPPELESAATSPLDMTSADPTDSDEARRSDDFRNAEPPA